ncbi:hypothetical protein L486_06463 [Kwoniella mangroviensis CBS 10435]|uniref:Uncharacterized protein n=1 Tax=Kwoniella mangroviensis CBS 10435 TaxID=1331196 RepID=A0A1B9IJI9_9TREE|nr:hypothetical protein L486_06463 [Kwoniella mangroviensis CBS 10435]
MSRLSPTAPSFRPSNDPSSVQIRQAYLVRGGRRGHDMLPHRSRASFRGGQGRYSHSPYHRSAVGSSSISISNSQDGIAPEPKHKESEIIGHSDDDNQQAASNIKAVLNNDADEEEEIKKESDLPTKSPVHPYVVGSPAAEGEEVLLHHTTPTFRQSQEVDDILNDISRIPNSNQENIWKSQNNHLLMNNHSQSERITYERSTLDTPAPAPRVKRENSISSTSNDDYGRHKRFSSEHIRLDGLGEGRSRNGYGRTLMGGQESGRGVIGNTSFEIDEDGDTTVVVSEAGCDIPMIREPWSTQARIPQADEGGEIKANIGPHTISLNPDLPPLAIEHPARVWNSMIHSLESHLQPVIKWDYQKILPQHQGQDTLWMAQLTLVLPSTHPIITGHPLFRSLPKNQWKKEYVAAVEAIGGVRKWVGEPRKLKADAQNTTLVRCISEDALAWVLAPNGIREVQESDNEDEDNVIAKPNTGTSTVKSGQSDSGNQFQHLHPELQSMVLHEPSQSCEKELQPDSDARSFEIEVDEHELEVNPKAPPAFGPAPHTKHTGRSKTSFQLFLDALHRTLGPGGVDIPNPASFSSNWESFTNKFGCTLTIGSPGNVRLYQEPRTHTYAEEAQNAVCQKALDLNVVGFMEWLKESLLPPASPTIDPIVEEQPKEIIVRPQPVEGNVAVPMKAYKPKWQSELAAFCSGTGMPPPRYHEQSIMYEGIPEVVSEVTIGPQTFSVPKNGRSTEEVQEYLARRVLMDHFGFNPREEAPLVVSTSKL